MEKINAFNVRVYALIIRNNQLMVLDEMYVGEQLHKLPGGGLEFSEGVITCLKRELEEELNLELKSFDHFYTQEDFVQSKFKKNEQLLTIYYKVDVENLDDLIIQEDSIQRVVWVSIDHQLLEVLKLPVDQLVAKKLLTK